MHRKRKVRIFGFVFLNLLLIGSLLIGLFILADEDDCESCFTLEKSADKAEAKRKGTLINSYRVIKTDFENDLQLEKEMKKTEFWKEHVTMLPHSKGKPFDDTLLVWSSPLKNEELKFKVFDKGQFRDVIETFGFWIPDDQLKDTIIIGVYKKEEVNKGVFIYTKN